MSAQRGADLGLLINVSVTRFSLIWRIPQMPGMQTGVLTW